MRAALVIDAADTDRADFFRRTYAHLAGAVLAFAVLESYLLSLPIAKKFTQYALNGWVWLGMLGAFLVAGAIGKSWARGRGTRANQYVGLGLYVVIEACIFVPVLTMASDGSTTLIPLAVALTVAVIAALAGIACTTRANFSGWRVAVMFAGFLSLMLMICSCLFGFEAELWVCLIVMVFACGSLLLTNAAMQQEFDTSQHVAAALCLFAGVMLLFWSMVRLLRHLQLLRHLPEAYLRSQLEE